MSSAVGGYVYLDRFDPPRLKSVNDQLLAIATLKFHALFPYRKPILTQSQVFDGLLPMLSQADGEVCEVEFQSLAELVARGNLALSLFNCDSLSCALDKAVSKGIDKPDLNDADLFEFSGIPFLQKGTPIEKVERRKVFKASLSKGRGETGDIIADGVINRVAQLDERLIRKNHTSSLYINVQPAKTTLSKHIEHYLRQNDGGDTHLQKQLSKKYREATAEQKEARSYYYQFNIDGLHSAIDAFYNAAIAESNTGRSTGPYTLAINDEQMDHTVVEYLNRLMGGIIENDGYDALIAPRGISMQKAIIEPALMWSDILKWERAMSNRLKGLADIGSFQEYINSKDVLLRKTLAGEYAKKHNWWKIGEKFFFAAGAVYCGTAAPSPYNAVAIAIGMWQGIENILELAPFNDGDIKKTRKIYQNTYLIKR